MSRKEKNQKSRGRSEGPRDHIFEERVAAEEKILKPGRVRRNYFAEGAQIAWALLRNPIVLFLIFFCLFSFFGWFQMDIRLLLAVVIAGVLWFFLL